MKVTSPTLHATILFTILVFAAVLGMSFVFEVEVISRGQGRVVPVARVQIIQPEFSGRIASIYVRDGSTIDQGQVLMEFDASDAIADLATITAEQQRLKVEIARIKAMQEALTLEVGSPNFVEQTLSLFLVSTDMATIPYISEQQSLLTAEAGNLQSVLAQVDARELVNLKSEEVTNSNIRRINAVIDIQSERLGITQQLFEQGNASRTALLDVQQAFSELELSRDTYLRELEQKQAERAALDSERRRTLSDLQRELSTRRAEIDARLATLIEEARIAHRRVDASKITAPISGVVDKLTVFTVGGIAQAGEELMRVVPVDEQVEFEAVFSNQDIGFMKIGQSVNIRLDSFPSERFGFVVGEVKDIAADSTETSGGQWGYAVRVVPDNSFLEAGGEQFLLRPGMTATIDVTTDKRRIISYFFAPLMRTIENALGER
jgi:hemolysin D